VQVVTRPGRTPHGQGLADLFAADPVAAARQILRRAAGPLTAVGIKKDLVAAGVARADADRAWPALQRRLAGHAGVVYENRRYRLAGPPPAAAPAARTPAAPPAAAPPAAAPRARTRPVHRRPATPDPPAPTPSTDIDLEGVARQRQARVDAVRVVAELASEVEELAANGAGPSAMIHRVRARVLRIGLEAIDRAGAETRFDRKRHRPISGSMADGTPVVVVRPGYVWKAPDEDVLIAKAIVEEES
jgi:hypothetical protein